MKMNSDTPAALIKPKDLEANTRAFNKLLSKVDDAKYIVDIRYGLGGWAKLALTKFPKARFVGLEQDLNTFVSSWCWNQTDYPHRYLYNFKWTKATKFPETINCKESLLLADFNTVTKLKRKELDEALESIQPKQLIFTDVSCSKLHLNYLSYGIPTPSLELYWKSFTIDNYSLVEFSKEHFAASSALYKRNF